MQNKDLREKSDTFYSIDESTIDYVSEGAKGKVKAKMNLGCETDGKAAQ